MRHPSPPWGRTLAISLVPLSTFMLMHAISTPALAQVSATIAADSDYRYRGVSLSDSKPSVRLTLNYDAPDDWYAGASATRVEPTHGDRYAQILGYGGYLIRADAAHHIEVGASYSHFTGDSTYDFAEAYVGLLGERWSARVYYAPNYFGRHSQSAYAELNSHHLLNERTRLFGHVGVLAPLRESRNPDGAPSSSNGDARKTRLDLRLGAGFAHSDWDLQLAWVAASRGGPYPAIYGGRRNAWVASASYSF